MFVAVEEEVGEDVAEVVEDEDEAVEAASAEVAEAEIEDERDGEEVADGVD